MNLTEAALSPPWPWLNPSTHIHLKKPMREMVDAHTCWPWRTDGSVTVNRRWNTYDIWYPEDITRTKLFGIFLLKTFSRPILFVRPPQMWRSSGINFRTTAGLLSFPCWSKAVYFMLQKKIFSNNIVTQLIYPMLKFTFTKGFVWFSFSGLSWPISTPCVFC